MDINKNVFIFEIETLLSSLPETTDCVTVKTEKNEPNKYNETWMQICSIGGLTVYAYIYTLTCR